MRDEKNSLGFSKVRRDIITTIYLLVSISKHLTKQMKKIVLIAVNAVLALFFWWKLGPWIDDPFRFSDSNIWLWPLVLFVLLAAVSGLSFLLLSKKFKLLIILLDVLLFLAVFGTNKFLFLGIIIFVLFQLTALDTIQNESQNRLQFKFKSVLKTGVSRLVTSFLILISFAYFISPTVQASVSRNELPSNVQKAVQILVGNYVGENLETQNPRLKAETTSLVLRQINSFLKPYFKFLPPLLAFALFIVLQGLGFVFVWLSVLVSFIVFIFLKISGLVKIEKKAKEAETISFE